MCPGVHVCVMYVSLMVYMYVSIAGHGAHLCVLNGVHVCVMYVSLMVYMYVSIAGHGVHVCVHSRAWCTFMCP